MLEDFINDAQEKLPHRDDDELTEVFYLLKLFESQWTPDDGEMSDYLVKRLSDYHRSQGVYQET